MFLALVMPVTAKGTVGMRNQAGREKINMFNTNSPLFFWKLGTVETPRNRDSL